jgi:hypothetical protein
VNLGDLGIEVEGPASSASELRGSIDRTHILSDYTVDALNVNPDTGNVRVKVGRLDGAIAEQSLIAYQGVLTKQPGDAVTNLSENRTAPMTESIQAAWKSYSDSAGSNGSGEGFRSWLDAGSGDAQARDYVNGLRDVYSKLDSIGLTQAELNQARSSAMQSMLETSTTRNGMNAADLSAAVRP